MTDQYRYLVEVFPPTYPVERPLSMWRYSTDGWDYLSVIDWSWHSPDASRGLEKPPDDSLVRIDTARAEQLAADRQGWFHYWVVYGDDTSPEPRQPTTVIRRLSSPEQVRDEIFGRTNQWVRTNILLDYELGGARPTPPLRAVDDEEAATVLLRTHDVSGVI